MITCSYAVILMSFYIMRESVMFTKNNKNNFKLKNTTDSTLALRIILWSVFTGRTEPKSLHHTAFSLIEKTTESWLGLVLSKSDVITLTLIQIPPQTRQFFLCQSRDPGEAEGNKQSVMEWFRGARVANENSEEIAT